MRMMPENGPQQPIVESSRESLPIIRDADRLVPVDFTYGQAEIEAEALRAVDGPRFAGYPEAGLRMTETEYDAWEKGDPENGIPQRDASVLFGTPGNRPPYYIERHPDRWTDLSDPDHASLKAGVLPFDPPTTINFDPTTDGNW